MGLGPEGRPCKGRACELWGKTKEEQTRLGAKQEARSNPALAVRTRT